jgi:hypothetical protein
VWVWGGGRGRQGEMRMGGRGRQNSAVLPKRILKQYGAVPQVALRSVSLTQCAEECHTVTVCSPP